MSTVPSAPQGQPPRQRPAARPPGPGALRPGPSVRRQHAVPPTAPIVVPRPDQRMEAPPSAWLTNVVVALSLGVVFGLPTLAMGANVGHGVGGFVASVLLTTSLIPRTNMPWLALILGTGSALLSLLLSPVTPVGGIIAVPLIVYSVARWGTQTEARVALGIGIGGALVGPAVWFRQDLLFDVVVYIVAASGCLGVVAAAYTLGRRRRESVVAGLAALVAQRERDRHLATERSQRSRIAAVSERQRIARELHDIVAHSVSVIVVQAEGGKALAAKRPETAPMVLDTIAETGREALKEMRRIVGLLRAEGSGDQEDTYVPSPGLDDLGQLVARTPNASLQLHGALPVVSQALGLSVYRVVQESLANVLKHGGPDAHAQVELTTFPDRLEVSVIDDGVGARASDGLGNGLRGMRERVAVHHGTFEAGPAPDGGFRVRMVVPLELGPAA